MSGSCERQGRAKRVLALVELSYVVSLLLLSTAIWMTSYGMWSFESWRRPPSYVGDALYVLAAARAFEKGEIHPVLSKQVPSLGAPFGANWNDFPMTEETIYWGIGLLARLVGLFPAAHFSVLLAHIMAALAFYWACRLLKYKRVPSAVGALLFAFSSFTTARGFPHVMLTYCWHLPLCFLVIWWTASKSRILFHSRKNWLSLGVGLATGVLNPYYSYLFLQFLGLSGLRQILLKRWRHALAALWIAAASIFGFALMNADTLAYRWEHGANEHSVFRTLGQYETYSLLPIRMFLPFDHPWPAVAKWVRVHYDSQLRSHQKGDAGAYLGIVGVLGFFWLTLASGRSILCGRGQDVPAHMWQILWILLFFMCGGGNWILGVCFDLFLFRAGGRYSIAILVLVLLYIVRQVSHKLSWRWYWVAVALLVLAVGLWDSVRVPRTAATGELGQQEMSRMMADRAFVRGVERQLPAGAMLFDFPVGDFPEARVNGQEDYSYLRPYLFADSLRFSFGTDKGRGAGDWQYVLEWQSLPAAVQQLEQMGFSGLLIHTDYLEDGGTALIRQLAEINRRPMLRSEVSGLVLVRLEPSAHPLPLAVSLGQGWRPQGQAVATGWPGPAARWSAGSAELVVINGSALPLQATLRLGVEAQRVAKEDVKVLVGGETVLDIPVERGRGPEVRALTLIAPPGETSVWLSSAGRGIGGTGESQSDLRAAPFLLENLEVREGSQVGSTAE